MCRVNPLNEQLTNQQDLYDQLQRAIVEANENNHTQVAADLEAAAEKVWDAAEKTNAALHAVMEADEIDAVTGGAPPEHAAAKKQQGRLFATKEARRIAQENRPKMAD